MEDRLVKLEIEVIDIKTCLENNVKLINSNKEVVELCNDSMLATSELIQDFIKDLKEIKSLYKDIDARTKLMQKLVEMNSKRVDSIQETIKILNSSH